MVAVTLLLDSTVPSEQIKNIQNRANLKSNITSVLKKYFNNLTDLSEFDINGDLIFLLNGPQKSVFTVRGYTEGIFTITIELFVQDNKNIPLTNFKEQNSFVFDIAAALKSPRSNCILRVDRGLPYQRYLTTSDNRLIELDIDQLVFETRSAHQKIEILHSKTLGNVLVLDNDQNMSESDLIYTETIMQKGKESYKDKEIIILGGGDGSLLRELLKENPKQVTMLEIDEMVLKACSQYMRSICGDCLDKKKGKNYEIIIGDCMKTLNQMIQKGQKVDYIFGDLTEIPINSNENLDVWKLIIMILNAAIQILKPTGKYMTHANGAGSEEALKYFEEIISQLPVPVNYTTDSAYIPSFYESWVFYQLSLK